MAERELKFKVLSIMVGSQGSRSRSSSALQDQETEGIECKLAVQFLFQVLTRSHREWCQPQWAVLLTSTAEIKTSQRPIFQMMLDSVKETVPTTTGPGR